MSDGVPNGHLLPIRAHPPGRSAPLRATGALTGPAAAVVAPPTESAPAIPSPIVRGEGFFRRADRILAWLDGWITRWLPTEHNPLAHAGAAANFALVVATLTGVALLIWYSPSVQLAYPSLEAIQGRTLGGWVRALHRYSSDLAMLLILIHAGRVFLARKFAGARWLAWVSGVGMMALVWFIGWTGYWLVWDQPAQQVAVSSMRLLDTLPVFGEPLGRLFISDRTVPSLLFFVVFFLHMLLPLGIALGLAVHLARVSRARLLPGREMSIALLAAMAVASVLVPAPLDAPAQMAVKAESFLVDAWYLSPLALGLRFQHAGLWVALGGGVLLGAIVPWLLGRRRPAGSYQAVVTPARCHACTQCVQDCPFDAIRMVPRTDGKGFPSQAQVDPARCVGCGVCGGSCDSEGIGFSWIDTRIEEARIERETATALARHHPGWVAFVAGEIDSPLPDLPGYEVQRIPTASWLRPKLAERLFSLGVKGILVIRDARHEAWARDGGRWVAARFAGERKPIVRPERSGDGRWSVVDYDPSQPEALADAAREFRRGGTPRPRPRRMVALLAGATLSTALMAASILPSHLRVENPTASDPEFVFSLKAFGDRGATAALDPAAEAAKPIHMRGRTTEKPRRVDVVVTLTINGVSEQRSFAAKGVSHDGPAIGEWRRTWPAGEHQVAIEVASGGTTPPVRWEGTLPARERRITVVMYDPSAGFTVH